MSSRVRAAGVPFRDLVSITLRRVIPAGLCLGAGMEGFMYATGFWDVATRKEAERRREAVESRRMLKDAHDAATGAPAADAPREQRAAPPQLQ